MADTGENSADADMGQCCSCMKKETVPPPANMFEFEKDLIVNTVIKPPNIVMAAIVDNTDGTLMATAPDSFLPDHQGIMDVIDGFNGKTDGLVERGINFGCGAPVSVPGKMVENRSLYGNDGKGGGCTVIKTKKCILIAVHSKDPAPAARMTQEAADHMEEHGR